MKEGNIASNIIIKNNSRLCGGSLASHNVMKSSKIGGGRKKKSASKSKKNKNGKKRKSNKKKSSKSSKKKKSTKKKRISKRKMKGGDEDTEINITINTDDIINRDLLLFFKQLAYHSSLFKYTYNNNNHIIEHIEYTITIDNYLKITEIKKKIKTKDSSGKNTDTESIINTLSFIFGKINVSEDSTT